MRLRLLLMSALFCASCADDPGRAVFDPGQLRITEYSDEGLLVTAPGQTIELSLQAPDGGVLLMPESSSEEEVVVIGGWWDPPSFNRKRGVDTFELTLFANRLGLTTLRIGREPGYESEVFELTVLVRPAQ